MLRICKATSKLSITVPGILGFTGLKGFVFFYFLLMASTSLGLVAKSKFAIHSYIDSWYPVLLDGFIGGLMSFVLFWTYHSLLYYLVKFDRKIYLTKHEFVTNGQFI